MKHVIIGTAGHVDHGKTEIVRALTGRNTDRLEEERRRGISIVLGFAPIDLGDGVEADIVDVPGHERFVKNMVSGAVGVDLALLVVAADEGVMPQTVEHFEVLRLLGVRDAVVAAVRHTPLGAWNHPLWWVQRVQHDWPRCWQGLLTEANRRPPMTLRVNARRGTAAAYVQRLAAAGRAASVLEHAAGGLAAPSTAVLLAEPCPVQQLPGFAEGEVSVQDAAAQLAAPLLLSGAPLRPGARVLDACAAPGGKTAHLLELAELDLLALDSDPLRLARVQETLNRLQLHAQLKAGDARRPADWWDGRPFDAILLDAPCTASGIVRRHPDVRWLRRPGDVDALARVQAELLDALWPLLAPGGHLLYATCSIFKAEGQDQIDAFMQRCPAGAATLAPQSPGHLLPSRDNPDQQRPGAALHDGFFYGLLRKT